MSNPPPPGRDTLEALAREALQVQDACNIRAVLNSALQAGRTLGRMPQCTGTDWVNTNPIMQMYASKIHSLTHMGLSDSEPFHKAMAACESLANGTATEQHLAELGYTGLL